MGRWIDIEVSVLADDILEKFRDDEILEEARSRQIGLVPDLLEELRRADLADFMTIAERMLSPKWTSTKACKDQYNLEMGR
ncbi:hypothetical protein [Bosea sp. AS-1]|uniref:hypothetical protein n=1 Tax=Bosea sp. AS-1 TaxID=2015316 RepID=UPI000B76CDAE|nr:hypothetical protein [Bosea sp. AS-1]